MRLRTLNQQVTLEIRGDSVYSLRDFEARGYSASAMRAARRRGLKVRYVHKRAHILGSDWLEYITNVPPSRDSNILVSNQDGSETSAEGPHEEKD